MADNLKIDGELRSRLFKAQSAEQVMEIIKESGQEIKAEDAEHMFQEISKFQAGSELSADELEAVSGGYRNYIEEGCAATVEPMSDCWGEDGGCLMIHYTYFNSPGFERCPTCNAYVHLDEDYMIDNGCINDSRNGFFEQYTCPNCGTYTIKTGEIPRW